MLRSVEFQLKATLTTAIQEWMDSGDFADAFDSNVSDIPHLGDNTAALMSQAALCVFMAIEDTQQSLIDEGMLKDEV